MTTIDLQRPAGDRWHLTAEQGEQARSLLQSYLRDIGGPVGDWRDFVRQDHWLELESLAQQCSVPVSDVALGNFYYDALKVVLGSSFGCTAFAVDTPSGVQHARNLDWWTENSELARFTEACEFVGAPAGNFITVGWPGLVGAFSGMAPARFAVTLNAVLSSEPAVPAMPVVLLLRTVLEEARSYQEALARLCRTPIPCDCLLLLTGTQPGEMAVIERTPTRHAVRGPEDGFICVTNGYQALDAGIASAPSMLSATCCQRMDRTGALVRARRPGNAHDCFRYLNDPEIRMNMTVQQMVFLAATGQYWTPSS